MAYNVNSLEAYFPVPSVQHTDETIDSTVRTLSALNARTRLVIVSPSVSIRATFDGTTPVEDGRGHPYGAGMFITLNEATAAAMKWIKAYSDDSDGLITVSEMERV